MTATGDTGTTLLGSIDSTGTTATGGVDQTTATTAGGATGTTATAVFQRQPLELLTQQPLEPLERRSWRATGVD